MRSLFFAILVVLGFLFVCLPVPVMGNAYFNSQYVVEVANGSTPNQQITCTAGGGSYNCMGSNIIGTGASLSNFPYLTDWTTYVIGEDGTNPSGGLSTTVIHNINLSACPTSSYDIVACKPLQTLLSAAAYNLSAFPFPHSYNVKYFPATNSNLTIGYNYILATAAPVHTAGDGFATLWWMTVNPPSPPAILANFTASPGFTIPQNSVVNFTDTSTVTSGNITGWNWTFGDGSTATTATFSKYYASVGSYNISLKVTADTNSTGAIAYHTLNVIPYNMTSNVTLNYDVRASDTGFLLAGASIGIQNTTDNIWRNSTSPTGLSYFTSTEPGNLYPLSIGQTVRLFAGMTGYQSSIENVTIPYNGYHAYQYLVPNGAVNATGAGTVVVNVVDNSNGIPISGASLTFDTGQLAITNTAGSATIYNVTAGNRTIQTSAPNYQSAVTGAIITAGATNGVLIQLVGVGQTPVATYAPGVTTPVPTDTYGNPISGNTSSSAMNTTSSAGILTMLAELIQLWPLGVLLVVLKAIKAI